MKRTVCFIPVLIVVLLLLFVSCNLTENKKIISEESTEVITVNETQETEIATFFSSTETITTETSAVDETENSETQIVPTHVSYWDNLMYHQPTGEEMQLIHKGMSFFEVVDVIGMPHMLDPDDSSLTEYGRVWVTTNGDSYCLSFSLDKDVDVDNLNSQTEFYSHLNLVENPYIVKTRLMHEVSSKIASHTIDGVDYYQLQKHSDYYITEPNTDVRFVEVVYKIIDGQPVDVTDDCIFFDDFFDWNLEHQPTIEEIGLIHDGMTYPEVEAIIGKPHRNDPNTRTLYIWVTSEGNDYAIYFKNTITMAQSPLFLWNSPYIHYRYSEYTSTLYINGDNRFSCALMRIKTHFCSIRGDYDWPFSSSSEVYCTIDGDNYYQIDKHLNYFLTVPSTVVDYTCTVYKIIDGHPVDVTDDCDWNGSINNYWGSWQPKCD
ncbi:MAG: hypothetical protein K6F14_01485 [Clostridiales bacterium]|nr:hypothetical protein [Clostridiales bacterium]